MHGASNAPAWIEQWSASANHLGLSGPAHAAPYHGCKCGAVSCPLISDDGARGRSRATFPVAGIYRYSTGKKIPGGAGTHTGHARETYRYQYRYSTGAEAAFTSAPPGTRRSAVTDAVGLAPSLLPRPGAVAITVVTTTALDRVSGVVCGDARRARACVPGSRGSGLVWRVSLWLSLWVGLVLRLRLVCEVLGSVLCVSRGSPRCL